MNRSHQKKCFLISCRKDRNKKSDTEGRGLFAKEPIRKGEIVSVGGGHSITRTMEAEIEKPGGYWGYPIADDSVLALLNTQEVEDVIMFLNHSCEPIMAFSEFEKMQIDPVTGRF